MKGRASRSRLAGVLVFGVGLATATSAMAGGLRGELRSGAVWSDHRTFTRNVVPESETIGDGVVRRLADGTAVICIPGGDCYWYSPDEKESSTAATQDLRLTAWGRQRGLSARVHLRGRYGSDDFWPRSQEELELVSGFLEWERSEYRLRAGRQSRHTGLGFYEFDGGAALWRALPWLSVEAYGGRSLARGLSQPLTGFLLDEADEFAPDEPGVLIGAQVRLHRLRAWSGSIAYQREIRSDRAALYSERISSSVEGKIRMVRVDGALDLDLAVERVNEARIQARAPLGSGFELTARGKYRRPYFDLWTIWEAFTPVGYEEVGARLGWQDRMVALFVESNVRRYDDANLEVVAFPVRDDGFQATVGGSISPQGWDFSAAYGAEVGFGASEDHIDARMRRIWSIGSIGLQGFAIQQTREFRRGEDWIVGGGLLAHLEWKTLDLDASIGWHRLSYRNRADYPDWNQKRARISLGYSFGSEPGRGATSRSGRSGVSTSASSSEQSGVSTSSSSSKAGEVGGRTSNSRPAESHGSTSSSVESRRSTLRSVETRDSISSSVESRDSASSSLKAGATRASSEEGFSSALSSDEIGSSTSGLRNAADSTGEPTSPPEATP